MSPDDRLSKVSVLHTYSIYWLDFDFDFDRVEWMDESYSAVNNNCLWD